MKWLKKLLGMEPVATSSAPADAGAKAFDNMAKTLSTPPAPVETVTVAPVVAPEVLATEQQDLLIVVYAWNFYDEIKSKIQKLRPNNNDIIIRSME